MARPVIALLLLAVAAASAFENSFEQDAAAWDRVSELFDADTKSGATVVNGHETEMRSTAEALYDAVLGGRLQMLTSATAVPINCSLIPGNYSFDMKEDGNVGFFHVILPDPTAEVRIMMESDSFFFVPEGEDVGVLSAYLPLMSQMHEPLSRMIGGAVMPLAVSLTKRTRASDPLFATVDLYNGRFIVNEEMIRFLPPTPPAYLVESYKVLGKMLERTSSETFEKDAPLLMVSFLKAFRNVVEPNPAICFMCIVIFAPIITIVANIAAAWYGQQMCIECELSDSTCNAVILYMVALVYQNLPMLAAILFKICGGFCVIAAERASKFLF